MSAMRRVALKDVARIERDIIEPSHIKAGTLFVGLENIEPGGRLVGVRPVEAGELASSKFAFTPRHVLYGKLRPYLAKIARPDFEGICSTDILPVLPGPDLDRSYLAWLLLTPEMVQLAASRATGANLPRLSPNALAETTIPLPPLPEQRRIAEILDKADALRAKRRAALAQLDTLTQSIFLEMFGDPATNPKGWPIDLIGDVAEIVSGATPRTDNPKYWDGTIRWVTPRELSDLEDIYIAETERHITEAGLQSCAATVLPPGSVLFSSRAPIGHTAICATPMATNQGFKSFIPKGDRLDAHYLLAWLRLRRRFLEGLGTGATFKEVSKAVVARIQISVPPLALQVAFANRIRKVQALREAERTAMALLDEQFIGLQHRAFSGAL